MLNLVTLLLTAWTLLMLASYYGNLDTTRLLLENGADIDADNGGGMTPLIFAAMFGRSKVVEQLQAHGASLQRRNCLGLSASFMVRVSRWIARLFPGTRFQMGRAAHNE